MISSIVVKKDMQNISFTKIKIDLESGKMVMHLANYNLGDELKKYVDEKHRVRLPCKIDGMFATFYVPVFWDSESIENYTQALMDELYLNKHNMSGCKTIEQIEISFMLEVVLL